MKKLLLVLLTLYSAGIFAADAKKFALVIGNASYPSARLKNPVNDANALADKLRQAGFEVILKTDANQKEMSRAINEFGERIKLGSTALFYYAGHGIQVRGKNFLIPVDADIGSEAGVRGESVDLDQVLDQLGTANVGLVILDACRNNPFETRFRRAGGAGLAQVDAPTGTLLAYATAPGKTAADGEGSNGLYTAALLKAMSVPGLKIEDVFKQVRNEVIKASDNQQIPWESSSLTAEFYFVPDNTKPEVAVAKLRAVERDNQELMQEMQKLKAELVAMKTGPVSQPAAAPETQAAATPPRIPLDDIKLDAAPKSEDQKPPTKLALAVPADKMTDSPGFAGGWTDRIKSVEQSKGQLTLAKALALLLDIGTDSDLTALVSHESLINHLPASSAYAVGIDVDGNMLWGAGMNWGFPRFAEETALENCKRLATDRCKLVIVNGSFNQDDFIAVSKMLASNRRSVAQVRSDFLTKLTNKPIESGTRTTRPGSSGLGLAPAR